MRNRYTHLTSVECRHAIPGHPFVLRLWCDGQGTINTGMNGYLISRRGAERALALLTPLQKNIDIVLGEVLRGDMRAPGSFELKVLKPQQGTDWRGGTDDPAFFVHHMWGLDSVRVQGAEADCLLRNSLLEAPSNSTSNTANAV